MSSVHATFLRELGADLLFGARAAVAGFTPDPADGSSDALDGWHQRWARPGRHVLLIPGVWETWRILAPLARTVAQLGATPHLVPQLGHNRAELTSTTAALSLLLRESDAQNVLVVGHSKGGLVGKGLLLESSAVTDLVAICAPFSGSSLSAVAPAPALRAFRATAPEIVRLSTETRLNHRITSLYPAFDPLIPGGSVLAGARNRMVPTVGHFRILEHPAVSEEIAIRLAS